MLNIQRKKDLTTEQLSILQSEMVKTQKSKGVMYLLWFFTGVIGGHRFYLGDTGYAVAMLFLGWATFGIWPLIDLFLIGNRLEKITEQKETDLLNQIS